MKRIVSVFLILAILCAFGTTAFAGGFDASKLKSSSLYFKDNATNGWKMVGRYTKDYSNVKVELVVFLSSGYVEKGWGPDLRLYYYDKEKSNYDTVDSIRIAVNDKIYCFDGFEPADTCNLVYGGEVMQAFLNSLSSALAITLEIDHTTKDGISYTATIDPVNIREMSDLAELGYLFEAANLWDPAVTTDLYENDTYYKAYILDNTSFDWNANYSSSIDWTDLIGYWSSRNGNYTFEMKDNGGYVTTIPVVPRTGDTYDIIDGILYRYFASNPNRMTPNFKFTKISDTEIEVYSYQTEASYTLYKRR